MPKGVYKHTEKQKNNLGRYTLKGSKHTEETKEKMRGNHNVLGKHWKLSKRARKNISKGHQGEKSYLWKGGITSENLKIRNNIELRLWREAVFARDNWTCQKYGTKGGKLHPHHIKNFSQYPKLRFAIDNGITFSEKAHREFHKKYGKKNNTREQLIKFLNPKRSDKDKK